MSVDERIAELEALVAEGAGKKSLSAASMALVDAVKAERVELARDASVGRRVLEAGSVGVVLVGLDGSIAFVNPKARALLRPRIEPLGRKPIVAFPVAELQSMVTDTLDGLEPEPREAHLKRRDLVLQCTSLPSGAMVTVRDVTADREARRARTDFVANVSHELRTPVTAIMGYAETMLLESERLPEDLARMAAKIDRNANRLRDLFEDLLQLHRIESRRRELPLASHALRPILEEAVIGAADKAIQRGQEFAMECKEGLGARCNPESLRTMVANLTSNAVNYTPDGGRITVRAEKRGAEVVVEIEDDGIGIDRRHHQRIFERFYRVDDARSRQLGGTGLGLALVKHLALASRSRVTVDSRPGEGSRFRIHLRPLP